MNKTLLLKKSLPLVALVLITLVALGGVAAASHDFSDVPDASPFHEDISWMAESGITEGFPDGTFKPGQPVTRQAMAAFMRRLAGDDPDVDPMVDAALLNGRGSADYDNAVSLNGRTPADYDDAVTLAGRTAADFDNAVSLNGRTPADFDDAVTLQGLTPTQLLPAQDSSEVATTTITGTTSGTATNVASLSRSGDNTSVLFLSAVADTTHDSLLLSCRAQSGLVSHDIHGITSLKIGDASVGSADRASISGMALIGGLGTAVDIKCWAESKVGSGVINIVDAMAVVIDTQ